MFKFPKIGNRGQDGSLGVVFGGVLLFVLSVILLLNVALPQLNIAIANGSPTINASNASQCLANCVGGANMTGYAGALQVAQSSYVITALAILAVAAGLVFLFFREDL